MSAISEVFSLAYPDIKVMKNNPSLEGIALVEQDIVFSHVVPEGLKLTLIRPWNTDTKRPLIVFVQGAGWAFPNIYKQLPQLSRYAQLGFVVAMVTHRNAVEGHAFPAYLEDVKTAIRFLRAHADAYCIDSTRVCIWGTSSGGNAAMLVGLTADDPKFKTAEYAEWSDGVQAVVNCYGPTNLLHMLPEGFADAMRNGLLSDDQPFVRNFRGLFGDQDIKDVLYRMSPVNYINTCAKLPPMLMIQGDADEIVPYEQAVEMYEKLYDAGGHVEMIRVAGGPHTGSFWSWEVHREIERFISTHIG